MTQPILYEIIETRNRPQVQKTKLDFLGTFEEAKIRAQEEARKNIGVRYSVFR